jgi:hypothetical protein
MVEGRSWLMPRRTKRQTKTLLSNSNKKRPLPANGGTQWLNKPGADLSLLLSKVRAAQVRRLHFR